MELKPLLIFMCLSATNQMKKENCPVCINAVTFSKIFRHNRNRIFPESFAFNILPNM